MERFKRWSIRIAPLRKSPREEIKSGPGGWAANLSLLWGLARAALHFGT